MIVLYALIHSLHHHKNDLEVLTVAMVCLVSKSNRWIKKYHKIKFSRPICIVWGEADHV